MKPHDKGFLLVISILAAAFTGQFLPSCTSGQQVEILKSKSGDLINAYKSLSPEAQALFRVQLDEITSETGCKLRLQCDVGE